jgi:hypothetical protein
LQNRSAHAEHECVLGLVFLRSAHDEQLPNSRDAADAADADEGASFLSTLAGSCCMSSHRKKFLGMDVASPPFGGVVADLQSGQPIVPVLASSILAKQSTPNVWPHARMCGRREPRLNGSKQIEHVSWSYSDSSMELGACSTCDEAMPRACAAKVPMSQAS